MDFQALARRIDFKDRRILGAAITASILGYIAYQTIRTISQSRSRPQAKVLASPRKSLQLLSAQDLDRIPYPPDALPGARDVDTPYGNIRVYEWGPEDGRKVLCVHGISTPSIAFAPLAKLLVEEKGCRVMLFDLFGRGYSDTPDPTLYHQNAALFASQILCVLASSPLSWTGSQSRFTLAGYSLGGCISVAFTACFPHLIDSLVLLAPAGLIRPRHMSSSSRLLYSNLLPESLVNYYVSKRLRGRPNIAAPYKKDPADAAESEVPAPPHPAHAEDSAAPIFPDRPRISPADAVAWQVDAHPGFLPAFISSINYAPITNQHETWRLIGRRQEAACSTEDAETAAQALRERKVLLLLGKQDSVIVADEVGEDGSECLGKEKVVVKNLEGGHDLPIVNARGVAEAMVEHWEAGNRER